MSLYCKKDKNNQIEAGFVPHIIKSFYTDARLCGGSILSDRYILTAAHCTRGANSVKVYLGAHDIKKASAFKESSDLIIHSGSNQFLALSNRRRCHEQILATDQCGQMLNNKQPKVFQKLPKK